MRIWTLSARNHPIVFTRVCEHMVVANSMALSLAGITKDSENPEGGEIERDENGKSDRTF